MSSPFERKLRFFNKLQTERPGTTDLQIKMVADIVGQGAASSQKALFHKLFNNTHEQNEFVPVYLNHAT